MENDIQRQLRELKQILKQVTIVIGSTAFLYLLYKLFF